MRALLPSRAWSLSGAAALCAVACDWPHPPLPVADAGPPAQSCPSAVPTAGRPCRLSSERFCEYTLCPEPSYVASCSEQDGWRVDEVPCYPSEPECPAQIPEPGSPCAGYLSTCEYFFENCGGYPSTLAECPGGTGSWVVIDLDCAGQDAGS